MKEAAAYPLYKSSGSEWLGDIPAHWNVKRGAAVLQEKRRKNDPLVSENYLSLLANRGIIPYAEKGDVGNKKPDDLTKCKLVSAGDFVINSMNYAIGSYGVSKYDGICSPVYVVMSHNPKVVVPEYVDLILSNPSYQKYAQSFGTGILDHRRAIGWDEIKRIPVAIPPIGEQAEIASYIQEKTNRINSLIEKKTRFVELLKEKRQAVITKAVTKGLDPSAPMKESGVEWIGAVPGHWLIVRLRFAARLNPSTKELRQIPSTQQTTFIPMEAIDEDGRIDASRTRPFDELQTGYSYFREDDVTVAKVTPCFENGKGAVMTGLHNGFGFGTTELITFRPREELITPYFLYLITRSYPVRNLGIQSMTGASGLKRVSEDFFKDLSCGIPPLAEQIKIEKYVRLALQRLDDITNKTIRSIALLKEHRSALITAAVTGKIDVRNSK